jgi:tetratricopeptide (TPR) repeat protein
MTTTWRTVALLAALVAVAYGGSLQNDLVFDDAIFMEHDPRLRSLARLPELFTQPLWAFVDQDGRPTVHQYYRPFQLVPLAVSHAVFGDAAWPGHALALVLHLVNGILAFALLRRLLGRDEPALLAAVLWSAHPGYSEAVLWVANLSGLGAAACTLAMLLLHVSPVGARRPGMALSGLLFLAGLLFKETAVLAPALLLLHDGLLAPDRGWPRVRRNAPRYLALVPPFALYAALRLHALGGWVPGLAAGTMGVWDVGMNAVALVPRYLSTFLWPFHLNLYHDFDPIHGVGHTSFILGSGLLLGAAVIVARTHRTRPLIAFGVAWAAVTMAPHLVARWPQLNVYAERYLYLPALGLLMASAAVPSRRVKGVATAGVVCVALLFVVLDIRRTREWRDEVTLFQKTLTQSRRAELVRNNLALRLRALGRYDEGIAVLHELLAVAPGFRKAHFNLGLLQLEKGAPEEAIVAFEQARRDNPEDRAALLNLGYAYDRAGRREQAIGAYLRLVRRAPHDRDAWYNLAVVAFELGQFGNARAAARRVLATAPDDAQAEGVLERASTFADRRRTGGGAADPATPARCAAARRAFDAGRIEEATVGLEVAAWLDEAAPLPHQYLANIYTMRGRPFLAYRHQREAVQRAPRDPLYKRNLASLRRTLGARARAVLEER